MLQPTTPAAAVVLMEYLEGLYRAARRGNAGAAIAYLRNEPERFGR